LKACERAIQIANEDGYTDVKVVANTFLPTIVSVRGDWKKGERLFRENINFLEKIGEAQRFGFPTIPSVALRSNYAIWLRLHGRFSEASEQLRHANSILRRAKHQYSESFCHFGACVVLIEKGDISEAVSEGERAREICEATEGWLFYPWVAGFLGFAYVLSGRVEEGLALQRTCLEQMNKNETYYGSLDMLRLLAESYYLAGDNEVALSHALSYQKSASKFNVVTYRPTVLELLGRIYSRADEHNSKLAEKYFYESLKDSEYQEYTVAIAHCHAGLGRLNHKKGKKAKAREELTLACEMYRGMDMTYYLRKAEQDLAALN
jgi:tetratricopeptide (TPR) repeat protein